jgi:hypothetical protein
MPCGLLTSKSRSGRTSDLEDLRGARLEVRRLNDGRNTRPYLMALSPELLTFIQSAVRLPPEVLKRIDRDWDRLSPHRLVLRELVQDSDELRRDASELRVDAGQVR